MLAVCAVWVSSRRAGDIGRSHQRRSPASAYLAHATNWRDPEPLAPDQLLAGPSGIFPYSFAQATADAGIGCMFTTPGNTLGGNSLKFAVYHATTGKALHVKYWDAAELPGRQP